MDDANTPIDPVIALVLAHAPTRIRPAWHWLWMLQKKINDGAARTSEPMLAQMRIAWWRDRIVDKGRLSEQRDPMLVQLADLAAQHTELPALAVHLLDKIESRILADTPSTWARLLGEEGAILPITYGQLAGIDGDFSCIGTAFICARAMEQGLAPADDRWSLAQRLAEESLIMARGLPLPRSLSLMRLHASQILANPRGPTRRRDGFKLVIHGLTGHPKY